MAIQKAIAIPIYPYNQTVIEQYGNMAILERKTIRFFSNFSTKPQFLYEGAIFLKKFNIKN
ncbi:MAG: hypothetical protein JJO71_37620 [Escherichia coli]|nr:hypothetical protein [Escherichia coli]